MAQIIESTLRHPAALLREEIDSLERISVKPEAATIVQLLTSLDRVEGELTRLEAEGIDLRSERVRWGNLTERLRSHPRLIARAAAAVPGGLAALRAQHAPAAAFWWHADEERSRRVRRSLLESAAIVFGVAAVLVVAYQTFIYFFPPDPRAVGLVQNGAEIDRLISDEDWTGALETAEAALREWPDEPEYAIWVAVLAARNGDPARAAEAEAAARGFLADRPVRFWLLLAETWLRAGGVEEAAPAADAALSLAPDDAEANFMKGRVAIAQGDRDTALEYLDRTYRLASEDNPQLAVNARVLWGELIQQVQMPPAGTGVLSTPAASPVPAAP